MDFFRPVFMMLVIGICSVIANAEQNTSTVSSQEYQTTVTEPNGTSTWVKPELRPRKENTVTSTEERFADKSSFGVFFFSLGGVTEKQLHGSDPSVEFFDNYISFNFKISETFAIALRPSFAYSTEGTNTYGDQTTNKIRARDFSVVTAWGDVFDDVLPANMSYKTQIRTYLPTSDTSKDSGMIVRIRWENDFKIYFLKHSTLRFFAKPSYYVQRYTTYWDNSVPGKSSLYTTPQWDLSHGADVNWSLSKHFGLKAGFEVNESWSNTSDANDKDQYRKSQVRWDLLGFEVKPTRALSLSLIANVTQNLIYADDTPETGFTLMTSAALF